MAIIYTSEDEAVRDFASLLTRVRAGEEVVIEDGHAPVAVLRRADPLRRSISESIARVEAYTTALGHKPVMDADFASDLEMIIADRKPREFTHLD